tara:strand:- start:1277 stop:1399 length:123 start_codon:yes stop_codon:yes gene_type:complete
MDNNTKLEIQRLLDELKKNIEKLEEVIDESYDTGVFGKDY